MNRTLACFLLAALLPMWAVCAEPEPRPFLSPVFGEHMVLQRGKPNRLWGWAKPGTAVRIEWADHHAVATAGPDGCWETGIEPPPAGGPYTLRLDGPQRLEFHDVLVGDVWLCSGQSNMEFSLSRARDGEAEAKAASHSGIRLFRVAQQSAYTSAAVLRGEWQVCEPATVAGFSAVAYYFGRKVHQATGIPIGLIQDAVGGSPAESWMSPETLGRLPEFQPALTEIDRLQGRGVTPYGNFLMHWFDEFDRGLAGTAWSATDFDDSAWKSVSLKQGFAELEVPSTPVVVWFRREINLPDPLPVGPARVLLGMVEKMDTVWLNGHWTGASAWVENPRAYAVPKDALHAGRNVIAIRVLKVKPDGGFLSPAEQLRLELGDGTTVPLEGAWRAAVSVDARSPHPLPLAYENWPTMPTVLYRGMLQPLAPLAITGALWYQGEANFTRAAQYRTLLPALIADWRVLFRQPDLPFYVISLPAFMPRRDQPGSDGWAELREAQAETVRIVPHTGLVVTVDTGDAANIHPPDKQPVGERAALLALRQIYGREIVSQGPVFERAEKIAGALRLHFAHTEGGLIVKGDKLGEFAVAGADRVWHWADAQLDGNQVIVSSPTVPDPVAVSYAWQANPLATLFNGAGLPAAPFRTDN